MNVRWLEAVLPLGIIAGFLCVMGNAQYFIHKAAHGRPKHIGNDVLLIIIWKPVFGNKMVFKARDHVQSTLVYRLPFSCCWFSIAYELYNNETVVKSFLLSICLDFCRI
ncbi:hypothetical protein K7X08_037921 [Anisodus acutangulus]|uniref:NADH dehydrogenase [ubiquinone] 1 alpha subcomplex subunit 1 n=1 Tax=Anisodus acutangulus TaxID=402998 RepID=A0A9Q1MXC7_9SOLA|nr:hypothetical protein K7X08_037921 [Anisodus acutangulus]